MTPTDEQSAIIALADDPANLQIIAYAGTGKTSTLEMFDRTMLPWPRLCLAFNKRIAEEVAKRLSPTTECRTFNSLGHRIWASAVAPKLVLDPKKTQNLFKEATAKLSKADRDAAWEEYGEICNAVGLAKGLGYIPTGVRTGKPLITEHQDFYQNLEDNLSYQGQLLCDDILRASITAAYRGLIDFNDQLYMPALFGGSFPRFPCILVDEAQDLSPVNHEMIRKLRPPRLVAVGDPFQSIYQFRGAMQDGMAIQRSAFSMQTQRLSVSFRCPSAIVENARWRAPGFRSLVDGGHVETLRDLAITDISEGNAVFICRNNAPLFALACRLLAAGRSCRVAGSDVGPKLINLLRRLGDESLPRSAVLGAIDNWHAKRSESASSADLADCLRIFANLGQTLKDAIAYAEHVLRQGGRVLLTTGHKAKGLEWGTVYHLDPWLIGKSEQELNLRYVIQTRAREAYYEIDSRDIN